MKEKLRFKLPGIKLSPVKPRGAEKWCDGWIVHIPMSYDYNGGTIIDGKWYNGYSVGSPIVPKGFELVSIHCGYQMNNRPPTLAMMLRPKKQPSSGGNRQTPITRVL